MGETETRVALDLGDGGETETRFLLLFSVVGEIEGPKNAISTPRVSKIETLGVEVLWTAFLPCTDYIAVDANFYVLYYIDYLLLPL